jgi:hypothetical protein
MPAVLRTVTATRYVTPLREGGSLPGLVEADDDGLYVLKFRGAGQGPKALAERFHWLTAPVSTVVQPSPVHTGLTADPAAELERLFARLVRR